MDLTKALTHRRSLPALCLLAALMMLAIGLHRHIPADVFFSAGTIVVCSAGFGYALVRRMDRDQPTIESVALGSGVGLAITPVIFSLLALLHAQALTVPLVLLLTVALLVRARGVAKRDWTTPLVIVGAVCFSLLMLELYNFTSFHYRANGDLVSRKIFSIDIPFLSGIVATLRDTGHLSDPHQGGLVFPYHDHMYRLLAGVAAVTHSHTIDVVVLASPIALYPLIFIAHYAVARKITDSVLWSAGFAASAFLVGGFLGTEQGIYALSPSYCAGSIILMNVLLLVLRLREDRLSAPNTFELALIGLFLISLTNIKITSYLVLLAGLGYLSLSFWRASRRYAVALAAVCSLSIVALAVQMRSSVFMPGGEFIIGGPLLGYANHMSRILGVSVDTINPISEGFHLHLGSLLLIPYFVFHLLRFFVINPKILVALIGVGLVGRSWSERLFPKNTRLAKMLFIGLPVGFLLPVLYSPAWYPLALSFYGPLVSIDFAKILALATLWYIYCHPTLRHRTTLLRACGVLLVAGVIGNAISLGRELLDPPRVTPHQLIESLHEAKLASSPESIFMTERFGLDSADESYYMYSGLLERPVVSAGAKYGSLLGAVADIDTIKHLHRVPAAERELAFRRQAIDSVFHSGNPETVRLAAMKFDSRYILEDLTIGSRLQIDPTTIADVVTRSNAAIVWKLR